MPSESDWIHDYISYATTLTDAPEIFHQFIAYSIVGAAMGNRWKIPDHTGHYLYPCLWTLLVGNSSMRKSTAAKIGVRIADMADIPLVASYGSTEMLAETFCTQLNGLMFADEFDQFLRGIGREYAAGRGFFTSLFDGYISPQAFRSHHVKGTMDAAVTFISCSTMAWLTDHLKETDITGGLLPRFILIPAWEKGEPMDFAPTAIDFGCRERLAMGLRWIAAQDHICSISDAALALYRAWSRRFEAKALDGERGEVWPERLKAVCKKLAMICHASSKSTSPAIQPKSMTQAIEATDILIDRLRHILNEELALTKIEKELQSIRKVLEQPRYTDGDGWVTHSVALKNSRLEAKRYHEVITTAIQSEIFELGHAKRGYPPIRLKHRVPGEDDR
jgi:hypothetical protein